MGEFYVLISVRYKKNCGGGSGGGGGGRRDICGGGQKLFPLPKCPDRLWGPRRLLFNGCRGSFLKGKGSGA